MLKSSHKYISPYSAEQIFDIVADIEQYPEFIPWVEASRVEKISDNQLEGELFVNFKKFRDSYVSTVTLDKNNGVIEAKLKEGAFKHLYNRWEIKPIDNGCEVVFEVEFQLKSRMLQMMIGSMFQKANEKMTTAFQQRADNIWG